MGFMTTDGTAQQRVLQATPFDLLLALVTESCLSAVVPITLELLERDPLASGGCFRGDLLRALLDLPSGFWGRYPRLYPRYLAVLRAGAAARRRLPPHERMDFWSPLDRDAVLAAAAAACPDVPLNRSDSLE